MDNEVLAINVIITTYPRKGTETLESMLTVTGT